MLYYHTMSFSEVDSVHVQALTRQRWMAEAPTWTTDRRASSPGSPSSESFCRLLDVGIGPLSEPGERQLMPKRPLDSTSTDGPPRVAIAFLSKFFYCPTPMQNWYASVPKTPPSRRPEPAQAVRALCQRSQPHHALLMMAAGG